MRIPYEQVPPEMKRDSLHPREATRGEAASGEEGNAVRRRKDERLEERSIRQRLIAPVITTNSHHSPLREARREDGWLYTIL